MDKKGLSGIVTIVLFVLLILAAIGIIWAFIGPFISEGAGGVASVGECLDLSLSPVSCAISYDGTSAEPIEYNITIERSVDDVSLNAVEIIFYEADGDTMVVSNNTDFPDSLGTRFYRNATGGPNIYESFAVAGTLLVDDEPVTCEQISERQTCA